MIDYTPGSAVSAGDVVVLGDHIGVALNDIAAGVKGALAVRGVFEFPKTAGGSTAIAVGKTVYWDASGQVMTETSTSNTLAGKTELATVDADTTVLVRLTE